MPPPPAFYMLFQFVTELLNLCLRHGDLFNSIVDQVANDSWVVMDLVSVSKAVEVVAFPVD